MNYKMIEMAEQQEITALSVEPQESEISVPKIQGLLQDTKMLNNIYKLAKVYSNSTMVPKDYQAKPDNCFVALELASRMGVSPSLVMQNLSVVNGRPSWSGQACIALINGSGKLNRALDFIEVGEEGQVDWGVYCRGYRKSDGKELVGTTITMRMAEEEGWLNKSGSKWKTMPRQMMIYRAASFFAKAYCPEVLMGFATSEEAEDITPEKSTTTVKL